MDFPSEILDDLSKGVPSGACPIRDGLRAEEHGWTTVRARRPRLHSGSSLEVHTTEQPPTDAKIATSSRFQVTDFDIEDIADQEDQIAKIARDTSRRLSKKAQQRRRRKEASKPSHEEKQLSIVKTEIIQDADASPARSPKPETWSPEIETFEENPIVVRHFWGMLLLWTMIAMCLIAKIRYA